MWGGTREYRAVYLLPATLKAGSIGSFRTTHTHSRHTARRPRDSLTVCVLACLLARTRHACFFPSCEWILQEWRLPPAAHCRRLAITYMPSRQLGPHQEKVGDFPTSLSSCGLPVDDSDTRAAVRVSSPSDLSLRLHTPQPPSRRPQLRLSEAPEWNVAARVDSRWAPGTVPKAHEKDANTLDRLWPRSLPAVV